MSTDKIKVSIICTAYNHEKFIASALDGFVMQKTNFSYEGLVHDDASIDGTADIIKKYAQKYPDIIVPVLQTENQYSKKVKITNDILLPMAKGEYIAFCEGDDFWTVDNKLQIQIDFLDTHPEYIACVHNTLQHDCSGKHRNKMYSPRTEECDIKFEEAVYGMQYQTSSLVIRKEYVGNMPSFYDIASKFGVGDLPRAIWYTLVGKVRFLPYNMSTYRVASNPDSWSVKTSTSIKRRLMLTDGLIEMYEDVKNYVSEDRLQLLEQVVLKQKFYRLEVCGLYDEMKKPPYLELWKQSSVKFRIKILLKRLFPKLYRKVMKIGE